MRTTVVPRADGRLNLTQEDRLHDWQVRSGETTLRIGGFFDSYHIEGLNTKALAGPATITRAVETFVGGADKAGNGDLTPPMRTTLLAMVDGMAGLLERAETNQVLEHVDLKIPGFGAIYSEKIRLRLGGESFDGKLRLWLETAVFGIEPNFRPESMRPLVPRDLEVHPVAEGIPTDRIIALLRGALAPDADLDKLTVQALALLGADGGRIGIERLSVIWPFLELEGRGEMTRQDDGKLGFHGRVSAEELDRLIDELKKSKKADTLQDILPYLLMARGIARQEGQRMVWDVSWTPDRTEVNGVDIATLQPPPAAAAPPKGQGQKKPATRR